MSKLRPIPASRHADPRFFVFKDLKTASHIFLRGDSIRRLLQPPYTGPYQIIDRASDGNKFSQNRSRLPQHVDGIYEPKQIAAVFAKKKVELIEEIQNENDSFSLEQENIQFLRKT
ncbi:unnamed protein product, partial [Brenthis ino]